MKRLYKVECVTKDYERVYLGHVTEEFIRYLQEEVHDDSTVIVATPDDVVISAADDLK